MLAAGGLGVLDGVRAAAPVAVGHVGGGGRLGLAVAVEAVGQGRVVAVPGGVEGGGDRARPVGLDRRAQVGPGALGHVGGGGAAARVAHQALLGLAVGADELTGEQEVVLGGGHVPGGLVLAGEGAQAQVGVPVEDVGALVARPVVVAVGALGADGDVGRVGQGQAGLVVQVARGEPGVGEAADGLAGVGVVGDVDLGGGGVDGVGVAVARLEPDELAVPVGLEGPLDIGLADGHGVAGPVEAVVVDGDVVDGAVPSGVADQGVDRGGQELGGGGVEQGQAVARVGGAVDGLEGAADDDLGAVGRHAQAVDLRVDPADGGGPVQGGPGGGVDGGQAQAGLAVDALEVAARVHGAADDVDRGHGGVEDGLEGVDERAAVGQVEGGEVVVPLAVDLVEGARDVEGAPVVGQGQGAAGAVEGGGEALDELAGAQGVGQDVGAGRLLLAGGRARGAGLGELAGGVHHVADDELVPHDAVDLGRGQRVRGVGGGGAPGGRGGGVRGRGVGVGGRGGGAEPGHRDEGKNCDRGQESAATT